MKLILLLSTSILFSSHAFAHSWDLSTLGEKTHWKKTGRYDEVERLCDAYPKAFPGQVKCITFGTTPEGRPMHAFIASQGGLFSAKQTQRAKRPVVFAQGGIHAGEIDGKDAGFYVMREILGGRILRGVFSQVTFVFVPVLNVDGHERFGKWNRPNQIGPEEMGWRTTSENLNLNRDYAKADSAEMRAVLRLLNEWDPIVHLDLHVTNGSEFQHEIAILLEPWASGPPTLQALSKKISADLMERMKSHLPLWFYPSFNEPDNPDSGVSVAPSTARMSHGYWARRNRIGVLVETHSWKDYETRVKATIDTLIAFLDMTAREGKQWKAIANKADAANEKLSERTVVLKYGVTPKARPFEFSGYAYERRKSEVSNKLMISYDKTKPMLWKLPLFDELTAQLEVSPPLVGYLIPPVHARLVRERLEAHGLEFSVVRPGFAKANVETFRATEVNYSSQSFEGRTQVTVKGQWKPDAREVPGGSLLIPVNQPKGELVLELMEPMAADSCVSWGFFNAVFEKKEYMEDYVAEEVAREMLKDPLIKAEFEKKLSDDPAFAKDSSARLHFFYQKHSSYDERYRLVPIYRVQGPLS